MEKKRKDITWWEQLRQLWERDELQEGSDSPWATRGERIRAMIVAGIGALAIWGSVNLSRDFTVNMEVPIEVGEIPATKALAERMPSSASVSFHGSGWILLKVYFSPPSISVNVTDQQVNLYDQIRQQMNNVPNVDVTEVQPGMLDVQLEDRITKKVPVRPRIEVGFEDQFDYLEPPKLMPDSIFLIGAESRIQNVDEWYSKPVTITGVRADINRTIALEQPGPLMELSTEEVTYRAKVAEFTEGEVRTFIRARNLPNDVNVNFTPSVITVKYDVPIQEYAEAQDIIPYTAFVTYSQIESDTTGYITPNVSTTTEKLHIRLRTFQPEKVGYFRVVNE
jgi:YbbR domain-containing protein